MPGTLRGLPNLEVIRKEPLLEVDKNNNESSNVLELQTVEESSVPKDVEQDEEKRQQFAQYYTPREKQVENVEERQEEEVQEDEMQQLRKAVADPFVAKPPKFTAPSSTWYNLFGIPTLSFMLLFICYLFDTLLWRYFSVTDFLSQLANPDVFPAQSKKIFTPLLLNLSLMYGVSLTVVGIVLDLAASKFTGAISTVFFRDWKVVGGVGFVVLINVLCLFVFNTVGTFYTPRASVVVTVLVSILMLSAVFPFMNYIFYFLDPHKVVSKIVSNGLRGVLESVIDEKGDNVGKHQHKAIASIEYLRDMSYKAIKKVLLSCTVH